MQSIPCNNPLRDGMNVERTPEPCTMVIFGASGDLTRRKLMPALYHLTRQRLLPSGFRVIGFARRDWSDTYFCQQMFESVNQNLHAGGADPAMWQSFSQGIQFEGGDYSEEEGYDRLARCLEDIDDERGTKGNRVFYLATPPSAYPSIISRLGSHGLAQSERGGWTRVIVEKPFGHDLESAQKLNQQLLSVFREDQIYRIDHYLGKETVQNILVFRFGNGIFEPIWNRRHIDHVQITVAENIGVGTRGGYYDHSGALRDMVQNHMMQLLALVAMEPPVAYDANAVRDEKVKVFRAIRPIPPDLVPTMTARGQYGAGNIAGEAIEGYREVEGVDPNSRTETYVALKLMVENWRWAGVPFYLRTGKALPKRVSEIAIYFRSVPHMLFDKTPTTHIDPNVLVMRIQPDEGITLRFNSKVPGQTVQIRPVTMDFGYGSSFGITSPEAYERLLLDSMLGDSTLFTRGDEVETSWSLMTPILREWEQGAPSPFPNYEAGTWGPQEANDLLAQDGRSWRRL